MQRLRGWGEQSFCFSQGSGGGSVAKRRQTRCCSFNVVRLRQRAGSFQELGWKRWQLIQQRVQTTPTCLLFKPFTPPSRSVAAALSVLLWVASEDPSVGAPRVGVTLDVWLVGFNRIRGANGRTLRRRYEESLLFGWDACYRLEVTLFLGCISSDRP